MPLGRPQRVAPTDNPVGAGLRPRPQGASPRMNRFLFIHKQCNGGGSQTAHLKIINGLIPKTQGGLFQQCHADRLGSLGIIFFQHDYHHQGLA